MGIMRLLVARFSGLAGRSRHCRVPALLPQAPWRPAQRCRSSYSGLSSAGGSNSDSEREGSPAAAAAELARVRRRQAEVDQERAALAAQLDLLEERQEDLYDEADVLFDQEGALVEQQGALVERECQLEGQLESLQERQEALFEEEETLAEQERQLQSLLGSQEGAAGGSWSVDVGGGGWSMDTGASGSGSRLSVDGGGSGGEERQEWGTASLENSEEEDEMWDPRYFNSIRAKWMLDGCTTLEECRQRLRWARKAVVWHWRHACW